MHLPPHHAVEDVPAMRDFIREHPFGVVTTAIKLDGQETIQVTHIPWVLDDPSEGAPLGTLRGHIARANPMSKAIIATADKETNQLEDNVHVLFMAPVNLYVPPRFYATKAETGKVVPTWNYSAVQVYGRLRAYHDWNDPATGAYLNQQVGELSIDHETRSGSSWRVEDAPKNYTDLLKKAIIGIEIHIDKIEGRAKLSQEMPEKNVVSVVEGFRALHTEDGDAMAKMVEEGNKKRGIKVA